jgi:hypothetical protein
VEALHHSAFLRRHQAAGLRADDPERVLGSLRVETDRASRGRSRDESARRALRVEAPKEKAHRRGTPHAMADLVARHHCCYELASGRPAPLLRERKRDRRRDRACVDDRFLVDVVELESVTRGAVHERRERNRAFTAHADVRSGRSRALAIGEVRDFARPRQRRAEKTAADAVEHGELDALDHRRRQVLVTQVRAEAREISSRVLEQRSLVATHDRRFGVSREEALYYTGVPAEKLEDKE